MGQLIYGSAPAIVIEDRLLNHLETVILSKIRRDESFAFHWDHEAGVGGTSDPFVEPGAWGTVWISKASLLYFSYDSRPEATLDRQWLHALAEAANSNGGLRPLPEPVGSGPVDRRGA